MAGKPTKTVAEISAMLRKELDHDPSIHFTIVADTDFVLRDANWDVGVGGYVDEAKMKNVRDAVDRLRAQYDISNV